MIINEDLINNFFKKGCTAEEADAVADYLVNHRDVLDKYLNQSDWNSTKTSRQLSQTDTLQILTNLKQQLFANTKTEIITTRGNYIKRFVAAAAVVFAVAGLWFFQYRQHSPTAKTLSENIAPGKEIKDSLTKIVWQVKANNGKRPLQVHLMDGSVVTLYKNSSIKFPQPFAAGKREIILSGEAFFSVAKNKYLPFIVFSKNLSTTALGTSFIISAYTGSKSNINIKLFTGKVVIKSTVPTADWKKDIYLLPNEQLTYHTLTKKAEVVLFGNNNANPVKTAKAISEISSGNKYELSFANTALPEVMNKLSAWYNVKINYTSSDISQMNFTGVINRSDDIQAILKIIAQMNGLELTHAGNGFSIIKP
jgi:ferric-dicitrate binding protein FerR (iron transport regulator)